jgi:hypothetical protein
MKTKNFFFFLFFVFKSQSPGEYIKAANCLSFWDNYDIAVSLWYTYVIMTMYLYYLFACLHIFTNYDSVCACLNWNNIKWLLLVPKLLINKFTRTLCFCKMLITRYLLQFNHAFLLPFSFFTKEVYKIHFLFLSSSANTIKMNL